jgi:hypothetical protein
MIAVTMPINLYENRGKALSSNLFDYQVSGHQPRALNHVEPLEL